MIMYTKINKYFASYDQFYHTTSIVDIKLMARPLCITQLVVQPMQYFFFFDDCLNFNIFINLNKI